MKFYLGTSYVFLFFNYAPVTLTQTSIAVVNSNLAGVWPVSAVIKFSSPIELSETD